MSQWNEHVLPHGELEQLSSRLWSVTGTLSRNPLPRNMIVHRLADGGLLLHSVVALNDESMRKLEQLGEPRVMIVPNGMHRLDAGVYKERYPQLKVVCPQAAREAVQKIVPVDDSSEAFLPKLGITCHAPDGVKPVELAYEFDAGDGKALVVTDLLFHLDHLPGFSGKILRWMGSSGFFGMSKIGKMMLLKDKTSFKAWLEKMSRRQDLRYVCVAHGKNVTQDAGAHLAQAAARL